MCNSRHCLHRSCTSCLGHSSCIDHGSNLLEALGSTQDHMSGSDSPPYRHMSCIVHDKRHRLRSRCSRRSHLRKLVVHRVRTGCQHWALDSLRSWSWHILFHYLWADIRARIPHRSDHSLNGHSGSTSCIDPNMICTCSHPDSTHHYTLHRTDPQWLSSGHMLASTWHKPTRIASPLHRSLWDNVSSRRRPLVDTWKSSWEYNHLYIHHIGCMIFNSPYNFDRSRTRICHHYFHHLFHSTAIYDSPTSFK